MSAEPRVITVSTAGRIGPTSKDTGDKSRVHYRTAVPLGVLDETARAVFTRGQCHSVAAALAEQDGWGSVVVLVERDHYRNGNYNDTILHCYAVSPTGSWVDVNGEHEPEGAVLSWQDTADPPLFEDGHVAVVPLTTDAEGARALATHAGCQALGIRTDTPLLPTSMPLARSIRTAVLRTLGDTSRGH